MGDRVIFQVDKAESEDKDIPWYKQECGINSDIDCNDILSVIGIH
jgi:hypothetical protein